MFTTCSFFRAQAKRPKVLLTGFEPLNGDAASSLWEVLSRLNDGLIPSFKVTSQLLLCSFPACIGGERIHPRQSDELEPWSAQQAGALPKAAVRINGFGLNAIPLLVTLIDPRLALFA